MNLQLLKQSIKSNFATWALVTVILNILLGQLLSLDMGALITQMYYNMLLPAIMSIYIIITGNKLLAGQVDRGSMAYILSTPIKRSTVSLTQAVYFIGAIALTFITTTGTFLAVNNIVDAGFANNIILALNLGGFAVSIALAGIMFAASGIFNLSKNVMGTGGLVVLIFLILAIVGSFADFGVPDLEPVQKLTILSLFNIKDILIEGNKWLPQLGILGIVGLIGFYTGGTVFTKKDLPL
ncbi:hypothetical protein [Streptococcus gallolyticus]|uniref:hypothetical protein n=1 Tax=Streptococcus gallolyticus TaxID=315405 RepID=UPI00228403B0|nr:hypothetical protein [Streptococcus gallolyticus]MCY7186770.1 hypothetical protein [Streptococcus gallolyticus subsp. gallolyticus]